MTAVRFLKSDLTKQLSCASQVKDSNALLDSIRKELSKKVLLLKSLLIIVDIIFLHTAKLQIDQVNLNILVDKQLKL